MLYQRSTDHVRTVSNVQRKTSKDGEDEEVVGAEDM